MFSQLIITRETLESYFGGGGGRDIVYSNSMQPIAIFRSFDVCRLLTDWVSVQTGLSIHHWTRNTTSSPLRINGKQKLRKSVISDVGSFMREMNYLERNKVSFSRWFLRTVVLNFTTFLAYSEPKSYHRIIIPPNTLLVQAVRKLPLVEHHGPVISNHTCTTYKTHLCATITQITQNERIIRMSCLSASKFHIRNDWVDLD